MARAKFDLSVSIPNIKATNEVVASIYAIIYNARDAIMTKYADLDNETEICDISSWIDEEED